MHILRGWQGTCSAASINLMWGCRVLRANTEKHSTDPGIHTTTQFKGRRGGVTAEGKVEVIMRAVEKSALASQSQEGLASTWSRGCG